MRPRPNYRLRAGDAVVLLTAARVDGYWFDKDYAPRGCWDRLYLLPGCTGIITEARTPCVTAGPNAPLYFSNIDIEYMGEVHRVRVFHDTFRRIKQ